MVGVQVPALHRWPQRSAAVLRPCFEPGRGRVNDPPFRCAAEQLSDDCRMNVPGRQAGRQIDPPSRCARSQIDAEEGYEHPTAMQFFEDLVVDRRPAPASRGCGVPRRRLGELTARHRAVLAEGIGQAQQISRLDRAVPATACWTVGYSGMRSALSGVTDVRISPGTYLRPRLPADHPSPRSSPQTDTADRRGPCHAPQEWEQGVGGGDHQGPECQRSGSS